MFAFSEFVTRAPRMRFPGKVLSAWIALSLLFHSIQVSVVAQDYDDDSSSSSSPKPPKEAENCNGVFVSYNFMGREKEYPHVKNVSAQSWAFKARATVLNTGDKELKSWRLLVGFRHRELLVSADGGVVVGGDGFPIRVGNNGTVLAGYPQADLQTAIDTAGDLSKMQAQVNLVGTQFGGGNKFTPMPKTIKLDNEGYKCPGAKRKGGYMYACCKKDPKRKSKRKTKFHPHRYGDLTFTYDILQAYESKYLAQVTMENVHPLGRLDQWNLTWEWMRNEFIYNMRGAFTRKKDPSECIYGPQGNYYADLDFSTVMNCQKNPVIADLPPEKANDEKVGKLDFCCKNGTLLPKIMNETKSKAIFQLEVFKIPPDLNRTAFNPPQNWKIEGRSSPVYKCSPPIRIDPTEFPDPTGIAATVSAIASWQVSCNMTAPKPKAAKCCVSYSAYYADAVIPCNTCACGCDEDATCNAKAAPLAIPPNALLVPFANRTELAKAFAKIRHDSLPRKLPCPDNCGVSINWHIDSDYKTGWTARMTIFNWEAEGFPDWSSAFEMKKGFPGYDKVYSFNGTELPGVKNTIFMQGTRGNDYLVGLTNSSHPDKDPQVPGKQQSVIRFSKKNLHMNVLEGDGFPSKVYFNGEECALPKEFPKKSGANKSPVRLLPAILVAILTFLLLKDPSIN